ncbi:hypothetical protein FRC07_011365, partial [Ceratobasidium sp. 392]
PLLKGSTTSSTSETKPPLKVDILAASKHQVSPRKPSSGLCFQAPTPKGGDDHLASPVIAFFEVNGKYYELFEDGSIWMPDEHGRLHSAAEIPMGAGASCRIPGEQFILTLDEEAFLCKIDETNQRPQRIPTWCLDNDDATGSSQVVPGRGCFHFRAVAPPAPFSHSCSSKTGTSLCNSLHGLRYNPDPVQVRSVFETNLDLDQAISPAPLSVSPEPSPSTSRAPEDFTIPNARTSLERRTCTHCNKVLRRPSALRIHINSHLNHRPWKCPKETCNYASTNETNLRRHVQKMHGEELEEGRVYEG